MALEENFALAAWFLALSFAGIFAGVRIWRSRKDAMEKGFGVPAWNATAAQIIEFFIIAIFSLVVVSLICSQVARLIFPDVDFRKNFLWLVPVMQPAALAVFVLLIKIRRTAFPRPINAAPEARAKDWLSPFSRFGIPALFAFGFWLVSVGSILTYFFAKFLPESAQAIFEEKQVLVEALRVDGNAWVAAACVPAIAIFTPILEELIFRAGLYRFFKSRMSSVPAAILSSVIFALLHDAPASYFPLTLFGCVLCFAYEKTGRIASPMIIHALFNANTLFCLFLASA